MVIPQVLHVQWDTECRRSPVEHILTTKSAILHTPVLSAFQISVLQLSLQLRELSPHATESLLRGFFYNNPVKHM